MKNFSINLSFADVLTMVIGFATGLIATPILVILGVLLILKLAVAGYLLPYLEIVSILMIAFFILLITKPKFLKNLVEKIEKNAKIEKFSKNFVSGLTAGLVALLLLAGTFTICSI